MKFAAILSACIIVLSTSAFAADKAADTSQATTKPAQEKKADWKKHRHHKNHFHGEVKAVDTKAGTITISRGEKTFTADEKLLSGINVGDRVSVKYTGKDGQLTATGIRPAKAFHKHVEQKKTEEKAPSAEEKK